MGRNGERPQYGSIGEWYAAAENTRRQELVEVEVAGEPSYLGLPCCLGRGTEHRPGCRNAEVPRET